MPITRCARIAVLGHGLKSASSAALMVLTSLSPCRLYGKFIAFLYRQRAFLQNRRKYNVIAAFTALGASPCPAWTQPFYPSMRQRHGRAYHRVMNFFRGQYNEHAPGVNKARMYIYDAVMMRQAEAILGVNMDCVLSLSTLISSHNSWISKNLLL